MIDRKGNKEMYRNLGEVCRSQLYMQAQYGARYADRRWEKEYHFCGEGLRIIGTSADYHSMQIHEDDIEEFVIRVKQARA